MDELRWLQLVVAVLGGGTAAWVSWLNLRRDW